MDEERKVWEQNIEQGEPDLWYGRFVKFMRLGTRRSVNAIFQKEAKKSQEKTRTNAGPEWYEAAKQWNWAQRAKEYDTYQRSEEDRIIEEEREKVLRSGFALQHKRIELLDKLSRKLIRYANDEEKVWIPETKTTSFGEDKSQVVEKVTFNAPLFQQIRSYQADIAAEMGERVKKTEITGKNGGPIQMERDPNLQLLTDEELAQAQRLATQLSSRQEGIE
jgi:hypothetical protein